MNSTSDEREIGCNMASELADGRLITQVAELPTDWHGSGSISESVLRAIAHHLAIEKCRFSVETGTGRSTLLFSHLSERHLVFTKEDAGNGDSLKAVQNSDLLRTGSVEFVIGPTQKTLLNFSFHNPIDAAYLDGPHAYPFPELEYWAIYPHIRAGGILILDDIQIPTINNMLSFLRADEMWSLLEIVDTTAFLKRTNIKCIDPFGEGWWLQKYNSRPAGKHLSALRRFHALLPPWIQSRLKVLRPRR